MARRLAMKVYYDDEEIELAGVVFTPGFKRDSWTAKADICQDAMHEISRMGGKELSDGIDSVTPRKYTAEEKAFFSNLLGTKSLDMEHCDACSNV